MSYQLIIGFACEGNTDVHFLESIIERTFEEIACQECRTEIDIYPVQHIAKKPGEFIDTVISYAQESYELGVSVLCVHSDADNGTDKNVFAQKITPAFSAVSLSAQNNICSNLVAIVPVQMIEAWMLADKELLKNEIGSQQSNQKLGIDRQPESIADPKSVIEEAIRVARQNLAKRRRDELTIDDIYQAIGRKIKLEKLATLPSYQKFQEAVRDAFRKLNLLQ